MSRPYVVTEVFSESPFGGNPLATVLDAAGLSSEEMQRIARAFNLSETTFFTGGDVSAGHSFRIFTPEAELPFAGHPTLGSAWVIRHLLDAGEVDEVTLNLGVGPIRVTFAPDGVLWMRQPPPQFLETESHAHVSQWLGLQESEIVEGLVCQVISTGISFLIVPLTSMEALRSIKLQPGLQLPPLLVFCAQGYESHQELAARVLVPSLGVPEDPATGSANGCLAAYLSRYQYFGDDRIRLAVGQGYEVERPSTLYLDACAVGDSFEINVGGRVRLVAQGQWLLC